MQEALDQCPDWSESWIGTYEPHYEQSSVALQPGLCQTWLETPKTGFLVSRLICHIVGLVSKCMCSSYLKRTQINKRTPFTKMLLHLILSLRHVSFIVAHVKLGILFFGHR